MKVTFDFDGTLTRTDVQSYFSWLINKGVDVWILTSRYDDLHKHRYPKNPTNEDLWKVVESLKFPRHKVKFMNMESKAEYLSYTDVIWHLDDDDVDIEDFNFSFCKTQAIDVKEKDWIVKCELLLDKIKPLN